MGEAKHRRSRCTCNRIGSVHKDGCPTLNPPPTTTTFVLTLDKAFADLLMKHYALIAEIELSLGNFIVRIIEMGLAQFVARIRATEKKNSLIALAEPGEVKKIVTEIGGR